GFSGLGDRRVPQSGGCGPRPGGAAMSGGATERAAALAEIRRLASAHGIGAEEIAAAMGAKSAPAEKAASRPDHTSLLVRLAAYLGGALLFAGLCLFTGMQWNEMNLAGRLTVTLGAGLAASVIAVFSMFDGRYRAAAPPFFSIGAGLQATGI